MAEVAKPTCKQCGSGMLLYKGYYTCKNQRCGSVLSEQRWREQLHNKQQSNGNS